MKFLNFTSLYHEILNANSSYLNFLKTQSIENFLLNKDKKDFCLKLYNAEVFKKKNAASFALHKPYTNKKTLVLHNLFYPAKLNSEHLSFIDNMYKKQIFKDKNVAKYESVKHLSYNGRYNLILGFNNLKLVKTIKTK